MQYIYNTGHNNGRVAQTIDNVLGETVNYTYDYLHRLTGATATNSSWGEAYSFDGFGNLTGKTPTVGSAPAFVGSAGSNAAGGALPANFDMENRLTASNTPNVSDRYSYGYDPWGRRVWRLDNNSQTGVSAEAYFYGATGQKLETYICTWDSNGMLWGSSVGINSYFAGKMLSEKGVFLATDRLGSVRGDSNGVSMSYYPWGEERGSGTADNRTKFAGYFRDMPGQDYAMARYYNATNGSFWSPDPEGMKTADSANPTSWNRYAYTTGDPVNFRDPTGRDDCPADACVNAPAWCSGDEKYYDPTCDNYSSGVGGGGEPTPPNPGGGGSGSEDPAKIRITNFTTDGSKAIGVQNSLRWIQAALQQDGDTDCNGWLTGVSSMIDTVLGNTADSQKMYVGVANFSDNTVAAIAGVVGTDLPPDSALITVNLNGAFYNSAFSLSVQSGQSITGGTVLAQVVTLLHELAHLTSATDFRSNDDNSTDAAYNNMLVEQHCKKTIAVLSH